MSYKTLYRLSGIALLMGGLLIAIGVIGTLFGALFSPGSGSTIAANPLFMLIFLLIAVGLVLVVVGLPGMYVRQAQRIGVAGLLGFVLTMFGVLLSLGLALILGIIFPWLAMAAPQVLDFADGGAQTLLVLLYGAFLLLGLGSLTLGMTTTQASVLPRGCGVLLIVSGIANLIAVPMWPLGVAGVIGHFLFAGGLAWAGYALVSQRRVEVVQPALPVEVRSDEAHG